MAPTTGTEQRHATDEPVPANVLTHNPTMVMGPVKFKFRGERLVGEKKYLVWRKQMDLFIRRRGLGGFVELKTEGGGLLDQTSKEAIGLFEEMLSSIAGELLPVFIGENTVLSYGHR